MQERYYLALAGALAAVGVGLALLLADTTPRQRIALEDANNPDFDIIYDCKVLDTSEQTMARAVEAHAFFQSELTRRLTPPIEEFARLSFGNSDRTSNDIGKLSELSDEIGQVGIDVSRETDARFGCRVIKL